MPANIQTNKENPVEWRTPALRERQQNERKTPETKIKESSMDEAKKTTTAPKEKIARWLRFYSWSKMHKDAAQSVTTVPIREISGETTSSTCRRSGLWPEDREQFRDNEEEIQPGDLLFEIRYGVTSYSENKNFQ